MAKEGLTNVALAGRLGVAQNTVNRWRNRWRRPRQKDMAALHDMSGGQVTPNDFFVLQDEPRPAAQRSVAASRKSAPVHRNKRRASSLQSVGSEQ